MNLDNANTNYVTYLIELSQSGRRNAFKDLCEINLKNVYTLVYHIIPEEASARKLTQYVFFIAWSEIKNYKPIQPFAEWIKKIAILYSVKALKYDLIYQNTLESRRNENSERDLEYYLSQLELEERIVLVLSDIEGLTFEEIQTYLPDLIIDEVKSKLISAREYLIGKLEL